MFDQPNYEPYKQKGVNEQGDSTLHEILQAFSERFCPLGQRLPRRAQAGRVLAGT